MRILLRILAVVIGWEILVTLAVIWQFWRGGFHELFAVRAFGLVTVVGWLLVICVGPFAVFQLWRLRESGRRATVFLAGSVCLYYLAGLLFFQPPGTPTSQIWKLIIGNALLAIFLCVRPVQRVFFK